MDPYSEIHTRGRAVDIRKPHPAVDSRTAAQRELDRMRKVMEAEMPPAHRAVLFAEADMEDPLLPEPPRPDWADEQENESRFE